MGLQCQGQGTAPEVEAAALAQSPLVTESEVRGLALKIPTDLNLETNDGRLGILPA